MKENHENENNRMKVVAILPSKEGELNFSVGYEDFDEDLDNEELEVENTVKSDIQFKQDEGERKKVNVPKRKKIREGLKKAGISILKGLVTVGSLIGTLKIFIPQAKIAEDLAKLLSKASTAGDVADTSLKFREWVSTFKKNRENNLAPSMS